MILQCSLLRLEFTGVFYLLHYFINATLNLAFLVLQLRLFLCIYNLNYLIKKNTIKIRQLKKYLNHIQYRHIIQLYILYILLSIIINQQNINIDLKHFFHI